MATNLHFDKSDILSLAATHPTTPASGGPVRFGSLVGVALTNEDGDGLTTIKFDGVFRLSVKAINDLGNSAVAAGDALWYTDADTPNISKKQSGHFVGFALEAVTSGATATIKVLLVGGGGSGTLAAGTIGATELGTDAVTTAKIQDGAVTAAKLAADQVFAYQKRIRVSAAQVNAGHTLVAAVTGSKLRLVDITLIAIGGNAAAADQVDILATQGSSGVKLVAADVGALTRSTVVKPNTANVAVLADGASFVANDASTAITIGKTGSNLTTATNIDVIITYAVEA